MTPGIPGVGLGGLFFIILALMTPIFELIRTIRGQSSLARWQLVARQAVMAVSIVVATTATLWLFELILISIKGDAQSSVVGNFPVMAVEALRWLPLSAAPVVITLLILVLVVSSVEMLRLVFGSRSVSDRVEADSDHPPESKVLR